MRGKKWREKTTAKERNESTESSVCNSRWGDFEGKEFPSTFSFDLSLIALTNTDIPTEVMVCKRIIVLILKFS